MIYRQVGDSDVRLSIIGLGGHKSLKDGSSRGFNEDFEDAHEQGPASTQELLYGWEMG